MRCREVGERVLGGQRHGEWGIRRHPGNGEVLLGAGALWDEANEISRGPFADTCV